MAISVRQIRDRLLDQDVCEWCFVPMSYLLVICLVAFLACTYQIGWIFTAERHFTLGESFKVCEEPLGNRCDTQYEVTLPDHRRDVFRPYGFEFESGVLHDDLALDKPKFSFTYTVDGQKETWPYLSAFSLVWALSIVGLFVWFLLGGPQHFGRALRHGEDEEGFLPAPEVDGPRKRRATALTAKAFWFVALLNAAMLVAVLVYGLGNIPFDAYKYPLKWFGAGIFLSALALAFDYLAGVDALSEIGHLDEAPRRLVRAVSSVLVHGALAIAAFVMGVISTVSLVRG